MTRLDALLAVNKADEAWQAQLVARFGAEAGQARYEARGRGSFDDALGAAFLARDKARLVWESLWLNKLAPPRLTDTGAGLEHIEGYYHAPVGTFEA